MLMLRYNLCLALTLLVLLPLAFSINVDEIFNNKNKIVFAQSCALSGESSALGTEISTGIQAAFNEINRLGGVWGDKTLELIVLDDGYETNRTVNNTKSFLEIPDLFGMIGFTGTGNAIAALELTSPYNLPFVGPLTGATSLRNPFTNYVVNLRSSYDDEATAILEYLVETKVVTEISLLMQDDSLGITGRDSFERVMSTLNLQFKSVGKFAKNTVDVTQALIDIAPGMPQAIVMVGTYAPLAEFVKQVKTSPLFPESRQILFASLSIVSPEIFADSLGSAEMRSNVIISNIVPSPKNLSLPIVHHYHKALHEILPTALPTYGSFEGYILGKLTYTVIQNIIGNLTRSNFVNTFYYRSLFQLDHISVGPYYWCEQPDPYLQEPALVGNYTHEGCFDCNQGLRKVWLTQIETNENNSFSFKEASDKFEWTGSCIASPSEVQKPIIFGQSILQHDERGQYLTAGIELAFKRYNMDVGKNKRNVKLITYSHTNASTLYENLYVFLRRMEIFGIIGLTGSESVRAMTQYLGRYPTVPIVGPSIGSSFISTPVVPNILNIRSSLREEVGATINYLSNKLAVTRLSFINSGEEESQEISGHYKTMLDLLDMPLESSADIDLSLNSDEGLTITLKQLVADGNNPQAVVYTGSSTTQFNNILKILSQRRFQIGIRDSVIIIFSSLIDALRVSKFLRDLDIGSMTVLASSVVSPPSDRSSSMVLRFLNQLDRGSELRDSFAALEGYLIGGFVTRVIDSMEVEVTASSFLNEVYATSSFTVDDVDLGRYMNTTSIDRSCNTGMRTTYMVRYNSTSFRFESLPSSDLGVLNLRSNQCGLRSNDTIINTIKKPYIFAHIVRSNDTDDYQKGVYSVFSSQELVNLEGIRGRMQILRINHDASSNNSVIPLARELVHKNRIFGFLGTYPEISDELAAFAKESQMPIFGPLSGSVALRKPYNGYVVNMRASILDEFVAMNRYFRSIGVTKINLMHDASSYWTRELQNILLFAKKDIGEKIDFGFIAHYPDSTPNNWIQNMAMKGPEALIILASTDITSQILTSVPEFKASNEFPIQLGIFSEVAQEPLFTNIRPLLPLIRAIGNGTSIFVGRVLPALASSSPSRSLLFTNETPSTLSTTFTSLYSSSYPDSNPTYMSFEGYLSASLIEMVMNSFGKEIPSKGLDISTFMNRLFSSSIFDFYGYIVGPIGRECQATNNNQACTTASLGCGCNQAAREVYLSELSTISGVMTSDVPQGRMTMLGCGTEPRISTKSFPYYGAIIIALALVVVFIVAISLGAVLFFRCRTRESMKYAPSKSGTMVCCFTDVQNSTKLWQMDEKSMRQALIIHNKIMRRNLELFRGFEVKTNGDSFMVMFKRPSDAIDWALAVQHDLLSTKWSSDLLGMYDCRQEWDDSTQQVIWNGIRVRMGIHSGFAEYQFDPTTKRPDYFGTTINTSARIEALASGGQVLISDALFKKTRHLYKEQNLRDDNPLLFASALDSTGSFSDTQSTSSFDGSTTIHSSEEKQSKRERNQRVKKVRSEYYTATDLGEFPLKGLSGTTRVYQVVSNTIRNRKYPEIIPAVTVTQDTDSSYSSSSTLDLYSTKKNKVKPLLETRKSSFTEALQSLNIINSGDPNAQKDMIAQSEVDQDISYEAPITSLSRDQLQIHRINHDE